MYLLSTQNSSLKVLCRCSLRDYRNLFGWFSAPKKFTIRFDGPTGHPLVFLTGNFSDEEFDAIRAAYGADPVNELAATTKTFDGPHKTHVYFFSHRLEYTKRQVAVFGHELAHRLHDDYKLEPDTTDTQHFGKEVNG